MPIVPWEQNWTRRAKRALIPGCDFADQFELATRGGIASDWSGWGADGSLIAAGGRGGALAGICVQIIDPRRRIVRCSFPAATVDALPADSGEWFARLYRTVDGVAQAQVFIRGVWERDWSAK